MRVADVESLGFPKAMGTARLVELLKEKYPSEEYEWGKMHILKGKYALQKRLERAIATLFPVLSFFFSRCLSSHTQH